jgi:hypothetical protein
MLRMTAYIYIIITRAGIDYTQQLYTSHLNENALSKIHVKPSTPLSVRRIPSQRNTVKG